LPPSISCSAIPLSVTGTLPTQTEKTGQWPVNLKALSGSFLQKCNFFRNFPSKWNGFLQIYNILGTLAHFQPLSALKDAFYHKSSTELGLGS
jgi:hypothetical protein